MNRKHTPAQAEAAAKEIASITAEYEELRAQIRARSPRYAALTQPQPLNLAEIQQQVLDPDTLLLEYSLGDNASYLFVVSQTSITSHQLPKRAEIEAATRRVRELLTAPQPQPGDTEAKYQARIKEARESYWPQAAVLSRMLLGPAASLLGGKRLLIVADGTLQYLPFGALPTPVMEKTGRQGDREGRRQGDRETKRKTSPRRPVPPPRVCTPLIVNNEIVHLPSASALAVLRRELAGRQPAAKRSPSWPIRSSARMTRALNRAPKLRPPGSAVRLDARDQRRARRAEASVADEGRSGNHLVGHAANRWVRGVRLSRQSGDGHRR